MGDTDLKRTTRLWGPVILWMGLIFIGSSWPSARVSQNQLVDFLAHKVVHLFEYGVLTLLLFRASSSWTISLILAALFGVADEWHQTFVPGRRGRWQDWLVDLLGVSLGFGGIKIARLRPMEIVTHSVPETHEVAKRFLSKKIEGGDILALYGDLGSGKTTFVAGLARALGVKERVASPSFVLIKEYKAKGSFIKKLVHVDLYHLRSGDDFSSLGLREKFLESNTLVAIEWADRLGNNLPAKAKRVFFDYVDEESRRLRFG